MISKLALAFILVLSTGCIATETGDAPRYYWHYTFHINSMDAMRHPELVPVFEEAVQEWDAALPYANLEVIVGRNTTRGLDIRFVNIQKHFEEKKIKLTGDVDFENIAGLYAYPLGIFIDTDFSGDAITRKSVIMHEIGHAFGLPHIVGEDKEHKNAGNIVVESEVEAVKYLMYPITNGIITISPMEISMAELRMTPKLKAQTYAGCCGQ